jgi:hypothetical protein
MKKTNVSSEVLIFQSYSVNSRPRSKHSSFSHGKYECFERGLDFTEQALKKQQKTHTHGSMKKTNVSSEVLILPKNLEKCAPRRTPFWAPKRTPTWVQEQPKTGSLFGPIFSLILGSLLAAFGCHLGPKTGPGEVWRSLREPSGAPRGQKDDFQKSGFRIGLSAFFHS